MARSGTQLTRSLQALRNWRLGSAQTSPSALKTWRPADLPRRCKGVGRPAQRRRHHSCAQCTLRSGHGVGPRIPQA
eukprot:7010704-Alexandrium_andersonii.AAC.1